jgi:hydrogenase nickel incorporation protein HypA/HybF
MHEVSVMSEMIKATLDKLSAYDVANVDEVVILIGDLTNLGEDQLTFAFEVMTRDTVLSGSELVIEHEAVRIKCNSCDYDGPAEVIKNEGYDHTIPVLSCPLCKSSVKVEEGMACCVRSVRFSGGDRCSN